MQRLILWLTILSLTAGTLVFPSVAGATEQYDDGPDPSETREFFPDDEGDEEDEVESAPEDQYGDEDLTVPETSMPEETTEETPEEGILEGGFSEEETALEETTAGETEEETSIEGPDNPEEESTSRETTGPDAPGESPSSGGGEGPGGGETPGSETGNNGERISVPPVTSAPPPEIGQEIQINVIDHELTLTIVDIYDGGVIYLLPNGERYEIVLYDLDYDGWISYYEMYVCTVGWFGYRYYDYTPDDMYRFIGDTYNINISNTYEQTGAIRPTPTERVAGLLPDTGGPALIGGAVALAVVGAALVGRYSKRS